MYYYHDHDNPNDDSGKDNCVKDLVWKLSSISQDTAAYEVVTHLQNPSNLKEKINENKYENIVVFIHAGSSKGNSFNSWKEHANPDQKIWLIRVSKEGYQSLKREYNPAVFGIPYDLKRLAKMLTDDQIKRFNESLENGGPPDIEALLPPRPDLLVACYLLLKLELSTESLAANDQISGHMKYWKEKLKLKLTNGEENAENPIISVDNLRCILEKVL